MKLFVNHINYTIYFIAIPLFVFVSCKTPKNHQDRTTDLTGINISIVDSFDVFSNVSSLKEIFDNKGCGTSRRLITAYSTGESHVVVYYEQVNKTIAYYDNKIDSTSIIELRSYIDREKEIHPESEFEVAALYIINPDTQVLFTQKSIHLIVNKTIVKSNYMDNTKNELFFYSNFNTLNSQAYSSSKNLIITAYHNSPNKGKNKYDKDFLVLVDINSLELEILDYMISEIANNGREEEDFPSIINFSNIHNEPYIRYGADSLLIHCITKQKRVIRGIEKIDSQTDFKVDSNKVWNFLFNAYTKTASPIFYNTNQDMYFYVTFGIDTMKVNPKTKGISIDFNCTVHLLDNELNYIKQIVLEDKRLTPEVHFNKNKLYIRCKGIGTKQNILSNKEIVSTYKVFEFYNEN